MIQQLAAQVHRREKRRAGRLDAGSFDDPRCMNGATCIPVHSGMPDEDLLLGLEELGRCVKP